MYRFHLEIIYANVLITLSLRVPSNELGLMSIMVAGGGFEPPTSWL